MTGSNLQAISALLQAVKGYAFVAKYEEKPRYDIS